MKQMKKLTLKSIVVTKGTETGKKDLEGLSRYGKGNEEL